MCYCECCSIITVNLYGSWSYSDMSHVDSGNYTCDVSGPGAQLLGVVKYTIHVKGEPVFSYISIKHIWD